MSTISMYSSCLSELCAPEAEGYHVKRYSPPWPSVMCSGIDSVLVLKSLIGLRSQSSLCVVSCVF